jgi:hypothetical protein
VFSAPVKPPAATAGAAAKPANVKPVAVSTLPAVSTLSKKIIQDTKDTKDTKNTQDSEENQAAISASMVLFCFTFFLSRRFSRLFSCLSLSAFLSSFLLSFLSSFFCFFFLVFLFFLVLLSCLPSFFFV